MHDTVHVAQKDYKLTYIAQWRNPRGEVKSAPRELPFRSREESVAYAWAREHAISLSIDPDLYDFRLVLPNGKEMSLDVSGVVRASTGAPETMLEQ